MYKILIIPDKILVIPGGHEGMYFGNPTFDSGEDALEYAMNNITNKFYIIKIIKFKEME